MVITPEDLLKLVLALVAGGLVGLERELTHKAAGFRTITLICVGATVFTILDYRIAGAAGAGRIAANIVTGIGFLGAGVIMHEANRVKGLTTAASVWVSAALGMGIGSGAYLISFTATALVLVVMRIFARLERSIATRHELRRYQVSLPCDFSKVNQVEERMRACGLRVSTSQRMKQAGLLVCTWDATGSTARHSTFIEQTVVDPDVKEIIW
jgi:putative Mg2+ transporter-C (MgtC) family protein